MASPRGAVIAGRRHAIILLSVAGLLRANDSMMHESGGNLMFVRTHDVAILKERLVMGAPVEIAKSDQYSYWNVPIHVEYELENTSRSPVDGHIGFPLPACSLGEYILGKVASYMSDYPTCVHEPKMKLSVDGRGVEGRWDFVFLRDGVPLEDVALAKKLRNLINLVGDPEVKDYSGDPEFLKLAAEVCTTLGGQTEKTKWSVGKADCKAFRKIGVHRTFLWQHTFPPGQRTRVIHDYDTAASVNHDPEEAFSFDAFCLGDPSAKTAWAKYKKTSAESYGGYPRAFFTEYVLKTGALWSGPIRDFELVILKTSPKQLVFTCFSGLEKTSLIEFKRHIVNFSPTEDLRVVFLP